MAEHSCKLYSMGSAIVNSGNGVEDLQGECGNIKGVQFQAELSYFLQRKKIWSELTKSRY